MTPNDVFLEDIYLLPSHYVPPEPPGLDEPMPLFPADGLVDFLRRTAPAGTWNRDDAWIDARNGDLTVSQSPGALDAIQATIDRLRRDALRGVSVRLDLLDLPTSLALGLQAGPGPDAGTALPARAIQGLEAALDAGDARRLALVRLAGLPGVREAVRQGVNRHYLQGFSLEIAEDALEANPVIASFLEGVVAGVRPALTTDRSRVALTLWFAASHVEDVHPTTTPYGPIDVPTLGILEARGDVCVPLERTALVFAAGHGPRTRVLLLTPTLERR
jgi:hypothetical protein